LLPLLAVVSHPTVYDSARHRLYVFPTLAVLAGIGPSEPGDKRGASATLATSCCRCAALVLLMIDQTILYPFNYTYLNLHDADEPVDAGGRAHIRQMLAPAFEGSG
jgi:hypothetical protein